MVTFCYYLCFNKKQKIMQNLRFVTSRGRGGFENVFSTVSIHGKIFLSISYAKTPCAALLKCVKALPKN